MESHLNDDQINELLRSILGDIERAPLERRADGQTEKHLKHCEICQVRVREQEAATKRLGLLKLNVPSAADPQCPPDDVWLDIAADTSGSGSETLVTHAAQCDHCGPILGQAIADLSGDLSPAEESVLTDLPSSHRSWQKDLAKTLIARRSSSENLRKAKSNPVFFGSRLFERGLVFMGCAALFIGVGFWLTQNFRPKQSAEKLIADAYTEKRTLEVRIGNAPYVPLRQERGADGSLSRMSRPALLKAEAEISVHLERSPEDPKWLQASGQAELLEGDPDSVQAAITNLQRARTLLPSDSSVSVDLASAYILRGQLLNRPEDFGVGIEILGRLVNSHQADETAHFNYALALEKELLKRQALEAWQVFLAKFPTSSWSNEARDHVSSLQKDIQEHDGRSRVPLNSVEEVASAFTSGDASLVSNIDQRIEEYQDVAIETWLPRWFSIKPSDRNRQTPMKIALDGLANLMAQRHQDCWLQDLLRSNPGPKSSLAVQSLAEATSELMTSDDTHTRESANHAILLFRESGLRAGELRASLIVLLLEQFQHRYGPCEQMAQSMRRNQSLQRYVWIAIQVRLEESLCASVSNEGAMRALQSGLDLAKSHGFAVLGLRATAAETGLYSTLGDSHRAWLAAAKGLRTYWIGVYPPLRGYNAVVALDEINYPLEHWFFETAILKEALPMIEGDRRTTMVAVEQARLGQTLMNAGDVSGAEKSYETTEALLHQSPAGIERTALEAEAELGFSKVDLRRNSPSAALRRLELIRQTILQVPDNLLATDFYETSGAVELRLNLVIQALKDLDSGITLAEAGLRLLGNKEDRLRWSRQNDSLYRAFVELQLRIDPRQAFLDWEWYKSAPIRGISDRFDGRLALGPSTQPSGILSLSAIDDQTALISYFFLPDGYFIWIADHKGIAVHFVKADRSELETLVGRFVEHCSNPNSDDSVLRDESARLYKILVLPIEPSLSKRHRLIVEPDGPIKAVPIELLLNSHSEFLGDAFSISILPGIAYLNRSRKWTGVSMTSEALVIGDPAVPGWIQLPAAQMEAREVASLFKHSHLELLGHQSLKQISSEIGQADVFHFAGHARASIDSPGLIFSSRDPGESIDLEKVMGGRSQLVVLSACSSSMGSGDSFDDVDSTALRLMTARVPEIIASRWTVDSSATASLMKDFYAELIEGKSPADALRLASQSLRKRKEYSHPFYWGGFSVFGST